MGTIDLRCLEQESSSTGNGSQTSSTNLSTSVLGSGDDWGRGSSGRRSSSSGRSWDGGDGGGGDDLLLGAWAVGDGQGGGTSDSVGHSVGDNRGGFWAVGSQSSNDLRNGGLVGDGGDGAVRNSKSQDWVDFNVLMLFWATRMLSDKNSHTYPITVLGNGARVITCSRHILDNLGNMLPMYSTNDTIEVYVSGRTYEFPQLVSTPRGLPVVCLTGKMRRRSGHRFRPRNRATE
ncbi:hypothetical protein KL909_002024 [Ogataea angusta]|nr:hypothetical protein KL909_002024 [Ogataea angusta]